MTGQENGTASLDVTQIGRYDSGMQDPDGGVMKLWITMKAPAGPMR